MKEKTFEELIEEKENVNVPNFIHFNDVLELLQQVREATITECKEVLRDYNDGFSLEMLERNPLPTNSIKTDL